MMVTGGKLLYKNQCYLHCLIDVQYPKLTFNKINSLKSGTNIKYFQSQIIFGEIDWLLYVLLLMLPFFFDIYFLQFCIIYFYSN